MRTLTIQIDLLLVRLTITSHATTIKTAVLLALQNNTYTSGCTDCDNYVHITQPDAQNCTYLRRIVPNGELHQAYDETRDKTQERSEIHQQKNIETGRSERQGSHNSSCGERKSCHRLVHCQNLRYKKSLKNKTTQEINLHTQGGCLLYTSDAADE